MLATVPTKKVVLPMLILLSLITVTQAATTNLYFYHLGFIGTSLSLYPNPNTCPSIRAVACNGSQWGTDGGSCDLVYFYNSTEGQWKVWNASKPDSENTLTCITSGYAYWFHVNKTGLTNDIVGTIIDPINDPAWGTMQPGWNLMGWTSDYDMNISDAVPLIYGNWSKNITRVWHYANNTDLIEPYWPENSSAIFFTYYNASYWVCVEDDTNVGFCEVSEPPLMPWQNQRPELLDASVTPSTGDTSTTFTFTVTYKDSDDDAPSIARVWIDGTAYDMTGNGSTDYTTGVTYSYSTTLSAGVHSYWFEFNDGVDHVYSDGSNTLKSPKKGNYSLSVSQGPEPPNAVITANPTNGQEPLTVSFDASQSTDPNDDITGYYWDFGDGNTDSGVTVTHTYSTAGTYTVTLTVVDSNGFTDNDTVVISVSVNNPPTADFSWGAARSTGKTYQFQDKSSDDGAVVKWNWEFGDGTTSSDQNPSHSYTSPGNYTVCLTVWDDKGLNSTTCKTLEVVNDAPTAVITANVSSGYVPLSVSFDAGSSTDDFSIVSYHWDFGDGTTSDEKTITHTYHAPGKYTVSLTVTDEYGLTNSASIIVEVWDLFTPKIGVIGKHTWSEGGSAWLAPAYSKLYDTCEWEYYKEFTDGRRFKHTVSFNPKNPNGKDLLRISWSNDCIVKVTLECVKGDITKKASLVINNIKPFQGKRKYKIT